MVRFHFLPLAVMTVAVLSLAGAKEASAATLAATPATLQATINGATAGDTINVSAGTTNSYIVVNKSLILHGVQFGVPGYAGSRPGTETVLGNGIQVSANNVAIDGFVISGGDLVGDISGTGVYVPNRFVDGIIFVNNFVQDNTFGLYLNGTNHIVQNNLFRSNNRPGAASGDGIYSDFGLLDATISNNTFTSNKNGSVVVVGGVKGGTADNITISNNSILNDGTIALYGASDVSVTGNVSWNTKNGHGLILGGGDSRITVQGNQFLASNYRGVRVASGGKFPLPNSDIRIYENDIANNKLGGLSVVPGSYSDTGATLDQNVDGNLDAECNAWGATNGPAPGGSGNKATGPVDITPYRKYMNLGQHVSVTRLNTIAGAGGTYLQVVRITNNGGMAVVGPAYFVIDGLSSFGITWNTASAGSQDDACQPPVGSPWYRFVAPAASLLPGQSLIVT
ncbi:MAG: hypothetical protein K0Q72_1551, partial [Armatimonadetes bacterium]|nr:hypothetical protein [Armatimonadota bacterium]